MLILIKDRRNIIITNFTFTRGHYHNPLWGDENIDKQCLGDMISIFNSVSATTANAVTKVWINKSSFANCGDECIGITRPVLNASQLFSISYSRFTMTDKTMILGGDLASDSTESNVKYIPYGERPYRISLYRSYFRETTQRNPRTMSAILHIYNNIFSDWDAYLVYNAPNETTGEVKSRVFMEENLFHLTLAANNIAENPNVHTGLFLYNNRATSFFTPMDNTDYGSGYPAFRDDWISPVYFNITAATLLTPTGIISKAGNVPQ
jgi:pectate lyase